MAVACGVRRRSTTRTNPRHGRSGRSATTHRLNHRRAQDRYRRTAGLPSSAGAGFVECALQRSVPLSQGVARIRHQRPATNPTNGLVLNHQGQPTRPAHAHLLDLSCTSGRSVLQEADLLIGPALLATRDEQAVASVLHGSSSCPTRPTRRSSSRTTSPGGLRRCGCARATGKCATRSNGHVRWRHERFNPCTQPVPEYWRLSGVESRGREQGEAGADTACEGCRTLPVRPPRHGGRTRRYSGAGGVGEQQVNLAVPVVIVLLPTRRQCDQRALTHRSLHSGRISGVSAGGAYCVRMLRPVVRLKCLDCGSTVNCGRPGRPSCRCR